MTTPYVVTGDDITIPVQLRKGAEGSVAPFVISGTGEVKARLVSMDHKSVYTDEIVQSSAAPGADWSTSLVVIQFAGADTDVITYQGKAKIEIQVADPLKTTWWIDCIIRKGNIA